MRGSACTWTLNRSARSCVRRYGRCWRTRGHEIAEIGKRRYSERGQLENYWPKFAPSATVGSTETISRYLQVMAARLADERQIDVAARHPPVGMNKRNYMHSCPAYLAKLIIAVQAFWTDMDRLTSVDRRDNAVRNRA